MRAVPDGTEISPSQIEHQTRRCLGKSSARHTNLTSFGVAGFTNGMYDFTSTNSAVNGCHTDDLRAVKTALNERALEFCLALFPAARREGGNIVVGSLNGEPGRSLSICISGPKVGRWKDFASGEGCDNLVELLRAVRGYSFAEACREVREWLGWPCLPSGSRFRPQQRPLGASDAAHCSPYRLSGEEVMRGTRMAERLITDPSACEAIARRRGWQPGTIAGLGHEAYLGLSEARRLTFLYDTGAKERWQENGERRVRFLFGKPDALWRGGLLPIAQQVFICEGETDAITLVDAGAEQEDGTLVVALPSASTLKPWWGTQLAGKSVILCLDADAAGQAATEKLEALLASHVTALQTVNLKVLLQ